MSISLQSHQDRHSRKKSLSVGNSNVHIRRSSLTSATAISTGISETVKQKQLQWMFNRRKQKLIQTSKQNLKLYTRIQQQKSILAPTFSQISIPHKKVRPLSSRININAQRNKRQDEQINNEIKKRNNQITKLLTQQLSQKQKVMIEKQIVSQQLYIYKNNKQNAYTMNQNNLSVTKQNNQNKHQQNIENKQNNLKNNYINIRKSEQISQDNIIMSKLVPKSYQQKNKYRTVVDNNRNNNRNNNINKIGNIQYINHNNDPNKQKQKNPKNNMITNKGKCQMFLGWL